jgi:hypothetical protein
MKIGYEHNKYNVHNQAIAKANQIDVLNIKPLEKSQGHFYNVAAIKKYWPTRQKDEDGGKNLWDYL